MVENPQMTIFLLLLLMLCREKAKLLHKLVHFQQRQIVLPLMTVSQKNNTGWSTNGRSEAKSANPNPSTCTIQLLLCAANAMLIAQRMRHLQNLKSFGNSGNFRSCNKTILLSESKFLLSDHFAAMNPSDSTYKIYFPKCSYRSSVDAQRGERIANICNQIQGST